MVGWKTQLSENDIQRLAEYVHNTFVLGSSAAQAGPISGTRAHGGREADNASTSPRVDMTVGLPNGLRGDPKRGGAFYNWPTAPPAMARAATGRGRAPISSTPSRATSSRTRRARA
jgi:hypothetical protein